MSASGDGRNHLRKRWVEASLELACLRCGVTQPEPVVDFPAKERRLDREIGQLEEAILAGSNPPPDDDESGNHEG